MKSFKNTTLALLVCLVVAPAIQAMSVDGEGTEFFKKLIKTTYAQEFCRAVKDGDIKAAESLLEEGCGANDTILFEYRPLRAAVEESKKWREMVELLFKHGAKIEIADKYGDTALTYALIKGKNREARFLLDRGMHSENGREMLQRVATARLCRVQEYRLLLEYGVCMAERLQRYEDSGVPRSARMSSEPALEDRTDWTV